MLQGAVIRVEAKVEALLWVSLAHIFVKETSRAIIECLGLEETLKILCEGCSENSAFYFIKLAHDIRGPMVLTNLVYFVTSHLFSASHLCI